MSGYLSNLAARALEQSPVVRPRLASLFEPPAGAGFRVAETLAPRPMRRSSRSRADAAEAQSTPGVAGEQTPLRVAEPQRTANTPLPLRESQERGESRRAGMETVVTSTPRPAPAQAPQVMDSARREMVFPPPQRTTPLTEVQREAKILEPKATGPAQVIETPSPVKEAAVVFEERVVSVDASLSATQPPAWIPAADESAAPAVHQRTLVVRPSVSAGGERPATIIAPPAILQEAPSTVHITIGRVDVRAVMPASASAAPVPREAKRSPSLSLDEYLRRRNGAEL